MGWFGHNKKALARWPNLSPEDAELCWKVSKCDSHQEFGHISRAISEKRYEALAEMAKLSLYVYGLRNAIVAAYRANDPRALDILLGCKSALEMHKDLQSVVYDTIVRRSDPWAEGLQRCLPVFWALNVNKLVDAINDYSSLEQCKNLMSALYAARPDDTARIVTRCLSVRGEVFDVALDALPIDSETPSVLAQAGVTMLEGKKIRHDHALDRMIALGMNVNHDRGALLIAALRTNRLTEAQKLIDANFNIDLLGHGVLEAVYSQSGQPEAIAFIEARVGKRAPAVPAAIAQDNNGFVLTAPDTVARSLPMPDGGSLTVMFNFTLRQQIVVAQQGGVNTPASAPTVIPFDMLGAPDALAAAALALENLGGNAALADMSVRTPRRLIAAKPEGGK